MQLNVFHGAFTYFATEFCHTIFTRTSISRNEGQKGMRLEKNSSRVLHRFFHCNLLQSGAVAGLPPLNVHTSIVHAKLVVLIGELREWYWLLIPQASVRVVPESYKVSRPLMLYWREPMVKSKESLLHCPVKSWSDWKWLLQNSFFLLQWTIYKIIQHS